MKRNGLGMAEVLLSMEQADTEVFPHLEKPDKATSTVPLTSETVVLEVMRKNWVVSLQMSSDSRQVP